MALPTPFPSRVVGVLRCPSCGGAVTFDRGGVRCEFGHPTPCRDGYLDAIGESVGLDGATRRTLARFGYEWTRWHRPNPEDAVFWPRYFADVDLASLDGRLGLDAGCGNGRFSRLTAPHLAALVAIDGSASVAAAAANLIDQTNAFVIRADLRTMPFESGSFGFISCLGVLHHLAEPGAGLDELVRVLAPGGLLLVYVYSRPERAGLRALCLAAAEWLRHVTVRLPGGVLRPLCLPLAIALYAVFVVAGGVGSRLGIAALDALPLAAYRGQPVRTLWLDTFDRLNAPIEARFTPAEVEEWFAHRDVTVKALRCDPRLAGITAVIEKR